MSAKRLTVRLDDQRVKVVERLSRQLDCDASAVVRRALDKFGTSPVPGTPDPGESALSRVPVASAGRPNPATKLQSATTCQTPSTAPAKTRETSVAQAVAESECPAGILELLPHYRAHGMELWQERRLLFQRILAVTEVICESTENPCDFGLREELMRFGKAYGQL